MPREDYIPELVQGARLELLHQKISPLSGEVKKTFQALPQRNRQALALAG